MLYKRLFCSLGVFWIASNLYLLSVRVLESMLCTIVLWIAFLYRSLFCADIFSNFLYFFSARETRASYSRLCILTTFFDSVPRHKCGRSLALGGHFTVTWSLLTNFEKMAFLVIFEPRRANRFWMVNLAALSELICSKHQY